MMRKLLFILFAVFIMPGLFAQSGLRPRGDVNCDWQLGIDDLTELIAMLLNGVEYNAFYTYAADINNDQEISIEDVTSLINGLLNDSLTPMPSFSGALPVFYINTDDYCDIVSKDDYLNANWWLDAMGVEGYESIGSADAPLRMQVKGHGNYTWNRYDKKSLRIKLDEKQPLMGMHSNRHFCLLAHADDRLARLKNTVGFELSRRIGLAYTPTQEPVEVVLNGEYIGLYFLTEKIRVGKHRVNIEEPVDENAASDTIDCGLLLEIDNNAKAGEYIWIYEVPGVTGWKNRIFFTHRSPENPTQGQQQWLKQYLAMVDTAIYSTDKTCCEWEQYIDIDTLSMYYIVGEIMDDLEYFAGSCYMYKHLGDSTKLIFGPVWDFGNAFQRWAIYGDVSFTHFFYEQPNNFNNHWIEEIAKFPHFQQVVKTRWRQFYRSSFNGLNLDRFVDEFVESIKPAFYADVVRWPQYDIDIQKKDFKRFIHRKIDWLNSQWGYDDIDPNPHEHHPLEESQH